MPCAAEPHCFGSPWVARAPEKPGLLDGAQLQRLCRARLMSQQSCKALLRNMPLSSHRLSSLGCTVCVLGLFAVGEL